MNRLINSSDYLNAFRNEWYMFLCPWLPVFTWNMLLIFVAADNGFQNIALYLAILAIIEHCWLSQLVLDIIWLALITIILWQLWICRSRKFVKTKSRNLSKLNFCHWFPYNLFCGLSSLNHDIGGIGAPNNVSLRQT